MSNIILPNGKPGAILDANGQPIAERKNLSPEAQAEMVKLVDDVQKKAEEFVHARNALRDFIIATRQALGIPTNEVWDISDDASYFEKVGVIPDEQEYVVLERTSAAEPVVDQTAHCADPGDVTGA